MTWLRATPGGAELQVRVLPRASRESIDGIHDGALKIHLTAPPVDGKANAALARLLGRHLRVPVRAIAIAGGKTTRRKCVRVTGLDVRQVAEAFGVTPPL
jgi:uncharacterized protein (TIGR00251 family)